MGQHTHTPTPWVASKPDDFGDMAIMPATGGLAIAVLVNGEMMRMGGKFEEHKANAAFIVAAVNSHATLTARVSDLESEVERLTQELEETSAISDGNADAGFAFKERAEAAEAAVEMLRSREVSAREFVKRHPALSEADRAEFEAYLKLSDALSPDAKGEAL